MAKRKYRKKYSMNGLLAQISQIKNARDLTSFSMAVMEARNLHNISKSNFELLVDIIDNLSKVAKWKTSYLYTNNSEYAREKKEAEWKKIVSEEGRRISTGRPKGVVFMTEEERAQYRAQRQLKLERN